MNVFRIFWVGTIAGIVFVILDALINANPLARQLYAAYRPIMRTSVNAPLGTVFDLFFGVVMAAIFAALIPALPVNWFTRGLAFGLMAWFFRVVMAAGSQIVMFQIPITATLYFLTTGLAEMLLIGLLYATLLQPTLKEL